jgi:hypothetical protein
MKGFKDQRIYEVVEMKIDIPEKDFYLMEDGKAINIERAMRNINEIVTVCWKAPGGGRIEHARIIVWIGHRSFNFIARFRTPIRESILKKFELSKKNYTVIFKG